jgi:hypothetical protein
MIVAAIATATTMAPALKSTSGSAARIAYR